MGLLATATIALPGGGAMAAVDLRAGGEVQGSLGVCYVTEAAPLEDHAPLLEIATEEGSVVLTADHWILSRGLWRRADSLMPGDPVAAMRERWPVQPRPPRHGWRNGWRRRVPLARSGVPYAGVAIEAVRLWPGTDPVQSLTVRPERCLWVDHFLVRG